MKLSAIVLSVCILSMGTAIHANAKPTSLKPSTSTAQKCFNIDEEKCNRVYDICQKNKGRDCKAFNKKWNELVKKENLG